MSINSSIHNRIISQLSNREQNTRTSPELSLKTNQNGKEKKKRVQEQTRWQNKHCQKINQKPSKQRAHLMASKKSKGIQVRSTNWKNPIISVRWLGMLYEPIHNMVDVGWVLAWDHVATDFSVSDRLEIPGENRSLFLVTQVAGNLVYNLN